MQPNQPNQKIEGMQNLSPAEIAYFQKMFGEPCASGSEQYIRIINMLGANPVLPPEDEFRMFLINDDMPIKQLVNDWYQNQSLYQKLPNPVDQYILWYQLEFFLHDYMTIADIKSRLGLISLPENFCLSVYQLFHSPYLGNGQTIEKNHKHFIDIPIKILLDGNKSYCFDLEKASTQITISLLDEQIEKQLQASLHPIECVGEMTYTFWVEKQKISNEIKLKLKQNKVKLEDVWKNNKLRLHSKFYDYPVRQFCAPGEVITVFSSKSCFKYAPTKEAIDGQIQITCFQSFEQNGYDGNNFPAYSLKRKEIKRKLSEIARMKISTLLREEKVEKPLVKSLQLNGQIFRPMLKFGQIKKIQEYLLEKKSIHFICLPDNLLFYKQIQRLFSRNNTVTVQEILNEIPKKKKLMTIKEQARQDYRKKRKTKQDELKKTDKVKEEHKNTNFFDPIMLYTSNLIYKRLNEILRTTGISLFENKEVDQDCWHYTICEKIISNLLKLDSVIGTVYRGSNSIPYLYQTGQIVEWRSFASTSKTKAAGQYFAKQGKSHHYLFEIKVYSGKSIENFSVFETQSQVLILPYSKFKVLEVNQMPKYTFIRLEQIPMSKRIPGHIVVWIDNRFKQNLGSFKKIVKNLNLTDFDLIQLESNEQLLMWLNAYGHIMDLPNVKVHFITNMNRSQERKEEGIDTLKMIRSFTKEAIVVFYINGVQQKQKALNNKGWYKDKDNFFVIQSLNNLQEIFAKKFSKQ